MLPANAFVRAAAVKILIVYFPLLAGYTSSISPRSTVLLARYGKAAALLCSSRRNSGPFFFRRGLFARRLLLIHSRRLRARPLARADLGLQRADLGLQLLLPALAVYPLQGLLARQDARARTCYHARGCRTWATQAQRLGGRARGEWEARWGGTQRVLPVWKAGMPTGPGFSLRKPFKVS